MKSNWKERGVVPDTDDEDEDDDDDFGDASESEEGNDEHGAKEASCVQKETASPPIAEGLRKREQFTILEQAEQSLKLKGRLSESSQRVREEIPDSTASDTTLSHSEDGKVDLELPPTVILRPLPSQDRAASPVHAWFDQQRFSIQQDLSQATEPHQHASSIQPADHFEDEISRTYVRLSSPSPSLSSIASSNFAEQESQFVATRAESPTNVDDGESSAILQDAQDTTTEVDLSPLEDEVQYQPAGRRSLRPRTNLQLHPFLIEAERHRNQFKGANLAPLRIVATQDAAARSHKAAAQNEDSQDTDFVAEGESQESQIADDSQTVNALEELLSSPLRQPQTGVASRYPVVEIPRYRSSPSPAGADDDDDDLPEMAGFLGGADNDEQRAAARRKTFKKIQARLKKAEDRETDAAKQRPAARNSTDVFDVPDSPPSTSSPISGASPAPGHVRSTPSLSHLRQLQPHAPGSTLPTPAASSSARRSAPQVIEVQSDGEMDAPASSIEQSYESSPLREPPPKLRKMLKGVLPASYMHIGNKNDRSRPAPPARLRDSRSISPHRERDLNRRGVALPRTADAAASSTPQLGRTGLQWLQDEEESEDERSRNDPSPMRGLVRETNEDSQGLPSVYSQSEFDFAMEDNSGLVDHMLPSQHKRPRQTQLLPGQRPLKRHKGSSTNLFKNMHGGPRYQPRIVDVFEVEQQEERQWHWDEDNDTFPDHSRRANGLPARPSVQRAIEEVMPRFTEPVQSLPPFLRIAARSAGSRIAIGRQGPARKFVRLDNREDTVEAQSVLRQWRGRSPIQKKAPTTPRLPTAPRIPLRDISRAAGNAVSRPNQTKQPAGPRTLQASLKTFKRPAGPRQRRTTWGTGGLREQVGRVKLEGRAPPKAKRRASRRSDAVMSTRVAQLEMSQTEYAMRNTQAAFGNTKRSLDRGFRHQHQGDNGNSNLTLQRFLEDSDEENVGGVPSTAAHIAETINRRRKRAPKQIDAETARYRQPEHIIASIEPPTPAASVTYFDDELRGLGGPNTVYPIDFDIKPLRSDIYFHESTFIGKGKLTKALELDVVTCISRSQHKLVSYSLGGMELKWGAWDETVSSQIRSCFEWLVQRLDIFANIDDEVADAEMISCMAFMVDFFQDALAFTTEIDVRRCIERMTCIMEDLTGCLEVLTSSDRLEHGDNISNRRIMGLSTFEVVLIFQVLRLATTHQSLSQDPNVSQLETLLQRAAATSVRLLFIVGLSPLDNLYEDLRQEAFRQGGIRENYGPAQAWVILMHIFASAKIRRVSFWDAVNSHVLTNIQLESNVKVLERGWRTMFTLLPLTEFDKFGILKYRSRYKATLENWALPQKLIRRVFDLYSPDLKDLASFTAYCNTLFNRCHHLIQAWGWRRYGSILGTLFDFFAKHQFSHIGPQKALAQQPEFLDDLDGTLSSFVVSDDQCFIVFLKIVHSATQQLRDAGDTKEIRNLVTRLLPNHSLDSDSQDGKELNKESLRNHHDLLFTLYWAAPMELREKIKVMLDSVERRKRILESQLWRAVMGRR